MAKNPLSDFTKKLDLGGIVKNVKTMINPMSQTPDVDIDDPLGVKMAQISTLLQKSVLLHGEQTKLLEQTNTMVNELYEALEAIRNPAGEPSDEAAPAATEASEAEKPEESEKTSDDK